MKKKITVIVSIISIVFVMAFALAACNKETKPGYTALSAQADVFKELNSKTADVGIMDYTMANYLLSVDSTMAKNLTIADVEFEKEYYGKLLAFLAEEYETHRIYPPQPDVFNALRYSSYADTKVVILGQDPYHQEGQAHGLCFSVNKCVKIPPKSKPGSRAAAIASSIPARESSRQSNPMRLIPVSSFMCILILTLSAVDFFESAAAYSGE